MHESSFVGKTVVVVTDTRRLGSAIAVAFSESGATVQVIGPRPAAHVPGPPPPSNTANPASVAACVDELMSKYGAIDVLVNAQLGTQPAAAIDLRPDDWEHSALVQTSSAFYWMQAVGRRMIERGSGVLINLLSVRGSRPMELHLRGCIEDAGLLTLTETLGVEWAGLGVRVVGVAVGAIDGEDAAGIAVRATPMRRLGRVDEVTSAVLYLASERASYITGTVLRVDGGWGAYHLF